MQKSLFEAKPFIGNQLLFKVKPKDIGRNVADAFGIKKTRLLEGDCGALENIFLGMHNLEIPPKMLIIQEGEETLRDFFVAGDLKKRNPKPYLNSDIPQNFSELKKYINWYSDKPGFACFKDIFKKCFNIEHEIRLSLLNQNDQKRFVKSFLADYKRPFNDFDAPMGGNKGVYAYIISEWFKSLSERAKKI